MDWKDLEREYVESRLTYAQLAARHGVSAAALTKRGYRGGWVAKRREYMRNMGINSTQNTHNTSEAVDPRRTQQKLLVMADRWADGDAEAIADTGDYRRVVQSVLDLARAADEGPREIRVVMEGGAEDYSV